MEKLTRHPLWTYVGVAVAYVVASRVGMLLAVPPSDVTPFWPPSGVALALLVVLGRRFWPGVLAGGFIAETMLFYPLLPTGSAVLVGAITGAGATLQAWVGAWLMARWMGQANPFTRVGDVGLFAVIAYGSCLINATVGTSILYFSNSNTAAQLPGIFQTWWLGDTVGVLVVAPLPMMWATLPAVRWKRAYAIEAGGLISAFTLVSSVVFFDAFGLGIDEYSLGVLVIPFAIWATHRGGLLATGVLAAAVAAVALSSAVMGHGPFAGPDLDKSILVAQLFVGVVVLTVYALGASNQQHRVAEAEARAGNAQLRALINAVPEFLVVVDGLGNCVACLSADVRAAELQVIAGQPLHGDQSEHTTLAIREVLEATLLTDEAHELEYGVRLGNQQTWWWARAVPLKRSDGDHVLWSARDITEQKGLESELRQKQKMETIGQLAGGISHDFNNLLTVIGGNAEVLLEGQATPPVELREIYEASVRAATLTSQLLNFSRKTMVEPEPLALNDVVRRIEGITQRLLGEGVFLKFELIPDLPTIHCDLGHVEQVLLNLVINARDAVGASGSICVSTDTRIGRDGRNEVVLRVRDDGTGITSDIIPHIFEPFFTTKAEDKGTGLGLSTVYGIVQRWDGDIQVESVVDAGTTFTVSWPAQESQIPAPPEVLPKRLAGGQRVLVVEDEPLVRRLTARVLRRLGYQVVVAEGRESALAQMGGSVPPIDVLLTDVMLGHSSGPEIASAVSEAYPYCQIVFMSAFPGDKISEEGVLKSSVNFVQKPFTSAELGQAIGRALDASEAG